PASLPVRSLHSPPRSRRRLRRRPTPFVRSHGLLGRSADRSWPTLAGCKGWSSPSRRNHCPGLEPPRRIWSAWPNPGHASVEAGTGRSRAQRSLRRGLDRAPGGVVMKQTSLSVDQPRFGAKERNLILGVVMQILRDPDQAEDAAQDAMLLAF